MFLEVAHLPRTTSLPAGIASAPLGSTQTSVITAPLRRMPPERDPIKIHGDCMVGSNRNLRKMPRLLQNTHLAASAASRTG